MRSTSQSLTSSDEPYTLQRLAALAPKEIILIRTKQMFRTSKQVAFTEVHFNLRSLRWRYGISREVWV